MNNWAVVAIDWRPPNVLSLWSTEEKAREVADGLDALALRAAVVFVPDDHPIHIEFE